MSCPRGQKGDKGLKGYDGLPGKNAPTIKRINFTDNKITFQMDNGTTLATSGSFDIPTGDAGNKGKDSLEGSINSISFLPGGNLNIKTKSGTTFNTVIPPSPDLPTIPGITCNQSGECKMTQKSIKMGGTSPWNVDLLGDRIEFVKRPNNKDTIVKMILDNNAKLQLSKIKYDISGEDGGLNIRNNINKNITRFDTEGLTLGGNRRITFSDTSYAISNYNDFNNKPGLGVFKEGNRLFGASPSEVYNNTENLTLGNNSLRSNGKNWGVYDVNGNKKTVNLCNY